MNCFSRWYTCLLLVWLAGNHSIFAQPTSSVRQHNQAILGMYEGMMDSADYDYGSANYIYGSGDIRPRRFTGKVKQITLTTYLLSGKPGGQYEISLHLDTITWYFDAAGHDTLGIYCGTGRFYKELRKTYDGNRLLKELQSTGAPVPRPRYTDINYQYNPEGLLEKKLVQVRDYSYKAEFGLEYIPQGQTTLLFHFTTGPNGERMPLARIVYNVYGQKLYHITYSVSGQPNRSIRYEYGKKGQLLAMTDSTFSRSSNLDYLGYADTFITRYQFSYQRNRLFKTVQQSDFITWAREEIPAPVRASQPAEDNRNVDVLTSEKPAGTIRFYRKPTEVQPVYTLLPQWSQDGTLLSIHREGQGPADLRHDYTLDARGNWVQIVVYSSDKAVMMARRRIIYAD